jgi:hypothetical protein
MRTPQQAVGRCYIICMSTADAGALAAATKCYILNAQIILVVVALASFQTQPQIGCCLAGATAGALEILMHLLLDST